MHGSLLKLTFIRQLLLGIIALVLSGIILRAILPKGLWYSMHDSTHIERVELLAESSQNGKFGAFWTTRVNSGFGYPLFHFYAPLFHTTARTLYFVFPSVVTSLKLTLFLFSFLGIYGTMLFAKRWGIAASILAGLTFALSPYLALDIFVRGAYAEFASLALLPWVFYLTRRLEDKRSITLASIFLSLFVLSHNLIPLIALPIIFIWMVVVNKSFRRVFQVMLLALALSAWFVLPLLFERGFVQADAVARTSDFRSHFVTLSQIWNSTWGFGGSAPGLEDGISFKLGKIQILLAVVGVLLAVKARAGKLLLLAGFAVFLLFLATQSSRFIWEINPILQIVQFPWRTLGVVALLLSIFSGYALSRLRSRVLKVVALLLVAPALFYFNLKYFTPQETFYPTRGEGELQTEVRDIAGVIPEYTPRWWSPTERLLQSDSYIFSEAPSKLDSLTVGPTTIDLSLDNSIAQAVSFRAAYYPTWRATVDGIQFVPYPDSFGLVRLDIPAGIHKVNLYHTPTTLMLLSRVVSLLALLFTLISFLGKGNRETH